MPGLADYANELVGQFPQLSFLTAARLVNQAWSTIRDEAIWSWNSAETPIVIAPLIQSAGIVTATFQSNQVVGDAAAQAVWNPQVLSTPPFAGAVGTGRQFRLPNGPIYSIIAYDGAGNITLDRVYAEPTITTIDYQIYKAYFSPPSDFLRYISITNTASAYTITGHKLTLNQEEMNRRDPQRGAQGDAYYQGAYRVGDTGLPIYEMWPHITNVAPYIAIYIRRGVDLTLPGVTPAIDIPLTIPRTLLMLRAEYVTCRWAMKNSSRYPELGKINWHALMTHTKEEYREELWKCRRQDMELFKQLWSIPFGTDFGFPVDARFLQSHDVVTMLD